MSKFINTERKVVLDTLVEGFKSRLNNPYYIHMDKKPSLTTYYNQNIHDSTLDEALKTQYSSLGSDSPAKYNKIIDFYIYGLEKIITDLENGDWGLEANTIEGEAIILPNTIVPIANDYFTINNIKNETLLFKVLSVTVDTIENGANFYKISYKLDQLSNESIEKQVQENYNMIINNIGTNFNTIIRANYYNFVAELEQMTDRLKTYYKNLFYTERVQTLILYHNYNYLYDPYLIEFIKRNSILEGTDDYLYITHQLYIGQIFALDYDKTFFRLVEMPNLKNNNHRIFSTAHLINDDLSIFSCRQEDYYRINYIDKEDRVNIINNFDEELLYNIYNNKLYDNDKKYLNIIIKYFNKQEILSDDIYELENVDYNSNIELFYNIPIIIYMLENKIQNLLK